MQTDDSAKAQAPTINLLSIPELKAQIGLMTSDYHINVVSVDITTIDAFSNALHVILSQCCPPGVPIPINAVNFLKINRTLLLRRMQDIVETQSFVRPGGQINISRGFQVPQPFGELLYALGPYYSKNSGIRHHLNIVPQPPAPPAAVQDWRALDENAFVNYHQMVQLCSSRYAMVQFPRPSQIDGQPLMLVARQNIGGSVTCKGLSSEVTPADAFLRLIHMEMFNPAPVYADAHFILTESLPQAPLRARYLGSYRK